MRWVVVILEVVVRMVIGEDMAGELISLVRKPKPEGIDFLGLNY